MYRIPVPIPSVIVKEKEAEKGERRRQARGAEKKRTAPQQDSPNYISVRTPTGMTMGVPLSLLSCVVQLHSEYSARTGSGVRLSGKVGAWCESCLTVSCSAV